MTTKKILITGATDGIGLATAKLLAADNHHLILHGRSSTKMEAAKQQVLEVNSNAQIETYLADFSSMQQVREFAKKLMQDHQHLDVLINNAGILKAANTTTEDGFDIRFAVNTFAPYLITKMLAPLMSNTTRVINLSSAAQQPVDFELMAGTKQLADDMLVYAQSKLAITMWTNALAKQSTENSPVYLAVNPGSYLASKMVKEGFGMAGSDINIGAKILCEAALSNKFANASGKYFDNDQQAFANPHPDALSENKCLEVLQAIEKLI